VYSLSAEPFSFGTEERLAMFGEVVATAIANAESRAQLDASRARIVATADATRRRIERDLHDGAQQLVSLALELRGVEEAAPPEFRELREGISRSVERMTSVLDELREISHGIHPAVLADGGLGPALKTLARRASMPVELDLQIEGRLPEPVEVTAYYVVSEALTNAAKYAHASVVDVAVELRRRLLRVRVRDDGRGGADPARGSGLLGLKDRAEATGRTLSLHSSPRQRDISRGGAASRRHDLHSQRGKPVALSEPGQDGWSRASPYDSAAFAPPRIRRFPTPSQPAAGAPFRIRP
jgi:signal transduction histidine kinase